MKIISVCLFALCVALSFSSVQADDAMLAWVSSSAEGQSQINLRVLQEDEWQSTQVVYQTEEQNYSPALSSNSLGDVMVVWGSALTTRSVLRVAEQKNGVWSNSYILADQGGQTTSPTVIYDRNDNIYLAWVSDHDGLDDIYIKKWSSLSKKWSNGELVNEANKVPDVLPEFVLNSNGDVVLNWHTYDTGSNIYVVRSRVYDVDAPSNKSRSIDGEKKEIEELSSENIEMPENWHNAGAIGQAVIHFPTNSEVKHEKLSPF